MSATLQIWNRFSIDTKGQTFTGKHGAITLSTDDPFEVTVSGDMHCVPGTLSTATVVTVYDDDDDVPVNWNYLFLWADQNCYIQLIGASTNVILPVLATVPFVLAPLTSSSLGVLAAANTTIITGGAEPTLTDIDSVVIGNYSGTSMNYLFAVVD